MFLSHIDVSLSLPSSLAKKPMKKMSLGEDKEKKRQESSRKYAYSANCGRDHVESWSRL